MPDDTLDPWEALACAVAGSFGVSEPTEAQVAMAKEVITRSVRHLLQGAAHEQRKVAALERIATQLEFQSSIEVLRLRREGVSGEEVESLLKRMEARAGPG